MALVRIHVYTATIGRTDELKDPSIVAPGVGYFCASGTPVVSDVWKWVPVEAGDNPVREARRFKINLHAAAGRADIYVWQDAAFRLEVDPHIFVPDMLRCDVLAFKHPDHDDIAAEAALIKKCGRANARLIDNHLAHCAGFAQVQENMTATGLLVRRNSGRVHNFNRAWWGELLKWGHSRDQMSVDYVARETGTEIRYLDGNYRNNPYVTFFNVRRRTR